MNIFIGTDSRGTHEGKTLTRNGWSETIKKLHPEHHYICYRSSIETPMATMFQIESAISDYPDDFFDISFIQIGYNEGTEYYSEGVFKEFYGPRFNPKHLIPDEENKYYRYWDEETFQNFFELVKKKSKRVVYIGFHSLERFHRGTRSENAVFVNEKFSKMATDYIELPQTLEWIDENTYDYIHYNTTGKIYILNKIEKYFNTFTSVFSAKASNPSSKNHPLYLAALKSGKAISELTQPGEVVLLAKKSGTELFASFLGAILTGRIPLIIQRPSPKVHQSFFDKRMTDLKSQIKTSFCFCEPQDNDKFQQFFTCYNTLIPKETGNCPIKIPKEDDLAFIQMSSGTTGVSKICEITHNQVVNHCLTYGQVIGMNPSKVIVSWLPLYHDMGLIAAFILPLLHDAKIYTIDPFDWLMEPKSLLIDLNRFQGTHCWMPSFAFNYLANKVSLESIPNVRLEPVEMICSCSEPTFCDDLRKFGEKFGTIGLNPACLQVCYALAENIFAVSHAKQLNETNWKGVTYASCGTVIPEVEVKIIQNEKDVTTSDDGEVWIKSPFMPRTNKCINGWYNTGDIGFFHGGNLHIIGRAKDMFVSFGVNVYPEMIEHLVANIEGVVPGRVVCFGVFSKEQGTNKVVVCAETEDVKNNKLRTELSSIIREEFGLTAIVILVAAGSLIKTSSGKFCRIKNKEVYGKINA